MREERTYWKWKAKTEVNEAIDWLKLQDMVGIDWNREVDLVSTSYKLFYLSAGKGKQNNVINKVKVGWTGRTVFKSREIQSTGTVHSMGGRRDWTENKLEGNMGIETCNIEFSVKI